LVSAVFHEASMIRAYAFQAASRQQTWKRKEVNIAHNNSHYTYTVNVKPDWHVRYAATHDN